MPTPEELLAIIVFSVIGFGAFRYGKRDTRWQPMVIGILLMGYPFVAPSGFWLYAIGTLLTVCLFIFRE